jgi:hypothetical protein
VSDATDDTETDEALTKAIAEIFLQHGLVLPAHVVITINGSIILRPIHDGRADTCH